METTEETKEVTREQSQEAIPGGTVTREKTSVSPVPEEQKGLFQSWMFVYYILGVIEVLLGFRLVFKGLGANPSADFVSFIYGVTDFLLQPFFGIFRPALTDGAEVTAIFEPATVIAMVVYAVLAWGLASLIEIKLSGSSK